MTYSGVRAKILQGWGLNSDHPAHSPTTWKCHITKQTGCFAQAIHLLVQKLRGTETRAAVTSAEFPPVCARRSVRCFMVFKSFDPRNGPNRCGFLSPIYKTSKLKGLGLECVWLQLLFCVQRRVLRHPEPLRTVPRLQITR